MNKFIDIISLIDLSPIHCQISTVDSESKFYIDSIYSKHQSEYLKNNVYLPYDFKREEKYPIIYATDASEILEEGLIQIVLNSLIEKKIIRPLIYIGSNLCSENEI